MILNITIRATVNGELDPYEITDQLRDSIVDAITAYVSDYDAGIAEAAHCDVALMSSDTWGGSAEIFLTDPLNLTETP